MKKTLFLLSMLFCLTTACFSQTRSIDGYFYINDNRKVDFFNDPDDPRIDYTETGVKAGCPFVINITKPSSGTINWTYLSEVSGTRMVHNTNNGHMVRFITDNTEGPFVLLATDSNGNQITITVYISSGGLSR